MDVKIAFLNGFIKEDVYMEQPPDFKSFTFLDQVFKLNKILCGLKQVSRAWYENLSSVLILNRFTCGKVVTTLFCKDYFDKLIIVQIYAGDIIFGATNELLLQDFSKLM